MDASALTSGPRRQETRAGREWNVQVISPQQTVKSYLCPGCGNRIAVGVSHVVAWRADGVLGDTADLENRRHWHTHCWQLS
ncbi:MAG: hypothetical protein B5766_02705 [Candidatus Lumbricidophila eiseniae]|uniref:ATP/GTP-binding protein n=1 Tax=Candidatus Lumbricidiphila eiseniae TaxID=1969409 RepID=A0A2A6FU48_9MICO|nr:MAG: hypothetical protein B5766_02705 [Candidatus Lumbricidophila eiseniae]